eukprot:jgi/Psemu1/50707/gm1.50707_g
MVPHQRHTIGPMSMGLHSNSKVTTTPKNTEISTLFTSDANDEGPRTLGPAPVTALRESFCNSITLEMTNIDELEKGHIAHLLDSCPVRFLKPGFPNQRIRNPQEFDSAGREAVRQAEATNNPEPLATVIFNINQWKFRRNWKTNNPGNYFNGIYTGEVQPDVEDETATAPNPTPTATGTDMQELTTLLQQLVNNGNNNNNNATNNNTGANHQSLDLPWNPATLPPPVKERYYRRDEFLTKDDMKDFPITYTDSSGNETIAVAEMTSA